MPYTNQPPEPDLPLPDRNTSYPLSAMRVHVKYMDPWQDQQNTRFFFGDDIARVWVPTAIYSPDGEYGGLLVGSVATSSIMCKWTPTDDEATTTFSPSTKSWSVAITTVSCTDNGTSYTYTVTTDSAGIGKKAVLMPYAEVFPVVTDINDYKDLGASATISGSQTVNLTAVKNAYINQYAIVICSGSGASYTVESLPHIHTP